MVSNKEIDSLIQKFKKLYKSDFSAKQFKYYTIAETLNRLTEGNNFPTTDYVRQQLYESGLSFDEMYKMSDRFANQLLLESSPDDCFSQDAQKIVNQSNINAQNQTDNNNNNTEDNNNENNENNSIQKENIDEEENAEGGDYNPNEEGGFNAFNADEFRKFNTEKQQQISDSVRLSRQNSMAHRELMAKEASEKKKNEELENKVKQGTLDADNLEITVDRTEKNWGNGTHPYTTGKMYVNGQFFCYTIENYDFTYVVGKNKENGTGIKMSKLKRRFNTKDNKIIAIPAGVYNVTLGSTTKYDKIGKVQNLQAIYKYQCKKDEQGRWKPIINNGKKIYMTVGNQPNGSAIVPRLNTTEKESGFGGILIHGGYNTTFTNGCILIVDTEPQKGVIKEQDITMLSHSKLVYDKLWNMMRRTINKGGKVTLTVVSDNENTISKPPQNAVLAALK